MAEKFYPSAKVVDGLLILSLPDALRPVVWQMDVGQSKSSALEVRPTDNDSLFSLVLKNQRQDVLDIAQYDTRDRAIRALITVSAAMEKAKGQIRPYGSVHSTSHNAHGMAYDYSVPALRDAGSTSPIGRYIFKPLGYMFGAVLLLAVLFVITSSMISLFGNSRDISSSPPPSVSNSSGNMSMSAEDFLEGR